MNTSDRMTALASTLLSQQATDLRALAMQVRRMERTLDEIVADAMEDAARPACVVVRFPGERRGPVPVLMAHETGWEQKS